MFTVPPVTPDLSQLPTSIQTYVGLGLVLGTSIFGMLKMAKGSKRKATTPSDERTSAQSKAKGGGKR